MNSTFSQFLALLAAPEGSLIYEIALLLWLAGALLPAVIHRRATGPTQVRRARLGLGMTLAAHAVLLTCLVLNWRGVFGHAAGLPALDRAVALISIVWIEWLLIFPTPDLQADRAAALLTALAVLAAGVNLLTWASGSSTAGYNRSVDDLIWQFASIGLVALGAAILFLRRTSNYGYGLAFIGLAFVGHAAHLLLQESGDYSGILRLAYLAAFPILLTLSQRFPDVADSVGASRGGTGPLATEPQRYGADPTTFDAVCAIAAECGSPKVQLAITRAVAQTTLADMCFLAHLTENKDQLALSGGYDLVREAYLEGTKFGKRGFPGMRRAILRGEPLRIPASMAADDTQDLSEILGLSNPGDLLMVPIVSQEAESFGAVILASPYSHRAWTEQDEAHLLTMAAALVPVMRRSRTVAELEHLAEPAQRELDPSATKISSLERLNQDTARRLEAVASQAQTGATRAAETTTLGTSHEQSEWIIEVLQRELASARANAATPTTQLQQELNASLREQARLQNQLAESSHRILELESDAVAGGAKNQQFEQIKSSPRQTNSLVERKVTPGTVGPGNSDVQPISTDLNQIIGDALEMVAAVVKEKSISIHLDVPEATAPVNAEPDAVRQILFHLLQIASTATPREGAIQLKVQPKEDQGRPAVLIQITHRADGIPQSESPVVTAPSPMADATPPTPGAVDSDAALSVAGALCESQKGRLWIQREQGAGTIYNVLLPIAMGSRDTPSDKEIN